MNPNGYSKNKGDKPMVKKQTKQVLAGIGVAIIAGGLGAVAGNLTADNGLSQADVDAAVAEAVANVEPVVETVEVPVEVEKIVEKNVTVEVPVEDNSFVELACDRLVYDDIAECKEEVIAEDAALKLALEAIESDYADELEDADIVADEEDAELVYIKDDYDDINVVTSNFNRDKYVFEIEAKIEDTEEETKTIRTFEVEVEDSEAKILSVN